MIKSDFFTTLINSGEIIGLAVSGGSDSMAMLRWFEENHLQFGVEFFVINIEHGIRGEESIADSESVRQYCLLRNIGYRMVQVDAIAYATTNKVSTETAARDLRYEVFKELVEVGVCDKVALAHHSQDQVETILMHIFRGTSIAGLVGMSGKRDCFIRPMLMTDKAEIMDYIQTRNIIYCVDSSNENCEYTRNFIRKEILPLIRDKYPNVDDAILRLASRGKEMTEYIEDKLSDIIYLDNCTVAMPISSLTNDVIGNHNVDKCFKALGISQDIYAIHINAIIELSNSINGAMLNMPKDIRVYREYSQIVFTIEPQDIFKSQTLDLPMQFDYNSKRIVIEPTQERDTKLGVWYFDADKLPSDVVIRHRLAGDIFTRYKGKTKSLGDYLTDSKVPKRLREKLLVGARDNVILFVIGKDISDLIKVDKQTTKLYKITMEEQDE